MGHVEDMQDEYDVVDQPKGQCLFSSGGFLPVFVIGLVFIAAWYILTDWIEGCLV